MSSNIYFIIGGVALVFIIYMIILQKASHKRKQVQLNSFRSNDSGEQLSEHQKRLLTFGAILSYYRGEEILGILPSNGIDQYVRGLSQQWEISNREEAEEKLRSLLDTKTSRVYDALLRISSEDLTTIKELINHLWKQSVSIFSKDEEDNEATATDVQKAFFDMHKTGSLEILQQNPNSILTDVYNTVESIINTENIDESHIDNFLFQYHKVFQLILQFEQISTLELDSIQRKIAKGLGINVEDVKQTQSVFAWDICRAVSLAKWCYWCGYIAESEMWAILEHAAKIANDYGKDWTDYTVSFLLGRTIQGFDLDDLIVESKQILQSTNPTLRKVADIDAYKRYNFKG